MVKQRWRCWRVGAILGLLLVSARSIRAEVLEAAFTEFPPYSQTDDAGRVSGIAVERLERVLAAAGFTPHVGVYPMRRAVDLLESGAVQVAVAPRSEAREKSLLFSDEKVVDVPLSIFWLEGTKVPASPAELGAKSVIALLGQDITIEQLRRTAPGVEFLTAGTHDSAVTMLVNGRAPYLLDYDGPVAVSIDRLGAHGLRHLTVWSNPGYVAVSRKAENAAQILARINAALKSLRAGGEFD